MIIGHTGKNAAGKGELANHLKSKGFVYFSLSDALRDEATKQGLDQIPLEKIMKKIEYVKGDTSIENCAKIINEKKSNKISR